MRSAAWAGVSEGPPGIRHKALVGKSCLVRTLWVLGALPSSAYQVTQLVWVGMPMVWVTSSGVAQTFIPTRTGSAESWRASRWGTSSQA